MWAMIVKEFRQLRRDRRTLAMMIFLPILLLIIFGYAASFDVKTIRHDGGRATGEAGRDGTARTVPRSASHTGRRPRDAVAALRDGKTPVAVVTGTGGATILLDGSQLFTANAAKASLAAMAARSAGPATSAPRVEVLYNPGLRTSDIMIPGLAGLILLFVGMVITSLGVVRERQAGTLEQLAVMPLRPRDVFLGKIAPYFLVAALDLAIVVAVGVALFSVPFRGSVLVFGLGALLFLFVTLGMGVLISSVSQTQGQAIQLAIMAMLPQIMLSGLIFPLSSMAAGVRWLGYLLPLTYFTQIARGVMLRGAPIGALWHSFAYLALIGVIVTGLATLRFRRFLAPAPRRRQQRQQARRRWRRRLREHRDDQAGFPGEPRARFGPGRHRLAGVRGVTMAFGEHIALRDVTLDVPSGQVTGVVGGDGAGKTTLLRILAGAVAPDSGEVRRPAPDRTGYLTASSGTYPDLSVQENLEFAAAGYGVPAEAGTSTDKEYLERTGLAAAQRRLAGNLSGGMRQKLGVIRAMLHEPDLLVLDEPTTGVDPVSRADLWWLIARAAAGGAAVVAYHHLSGRGRTRRLCARARRRQATRTGDPRRDHRGG